MKSELCALELRTQSHKKEEKMATFSQVSMAALFVGLCVLTWNDMTSSQPEPTIQKDIKSLKLTKFAGPTIKFMFW